MNLVVIAILAILVIVFFPGIFGFLFAIIGSLLDGIGPVIFVLFIVYGIAGLMKSAKKTKQEKKKKEKKDLPPKSKPILRLESFENIWQSVVMIKDAERKGSGVIIRPNIVATSFHVTEGDIVVYNSENQKINETVSFSAKIIHRNEKHGFCILEVNEMSGIPAKIRKYDTLKADENVYSLGASDGLDLSLSKGLISKLQPNDKILYIQTDAATSQGSSGGGLFDKEGNFIGILTRKYANKQTEGICFAIPADLVLKF